MVGTDPARGSATTVVPTVIISLRIVFAAAVVPVPPNTALDPSIDTFGGQTILNATRNSPIFQSANYAAGSTNLGFTQFADAFQRANFWNFVSTRSPGYHVLLDQPQINVQTINVPIDKGVIGYQFGTTTLIGLVDIDWFDQQLRGLLTTLHIDPGTLPIFLGHNLILTSGGIPLALGYHDAIQQQSRRDRGLQTYIETTYIDPTLGPGGTDASVLSHEVSEWLDDPFVNNLVPFWQFPDETLACFGFFDNPGKGLLEVGDPVESPGFPEIEVTTNGTTYHLQDEVFLSWFARDSPSKSVNGWYTFANNWDVFSEPCFNFSDYTYETVDVPGALRTYLRGINNRGDVVGRYRDSAGQLHAFVRKDGIYTTIDPPGAVLAEARKLNDTGDIVGLYVDTTGQEHGFLLKGGMFRSLDVPGATDTFAYGINNEGTVVGGYTDANGIIHAFTLQRGQFRTVEVPFALQEQIEAISDAGDIVGDYDVTGSPDESFGFIGRVNRFQPLNFPGSFFTSLTSLNNRGGVAGYYEFKFRTFFSGDDFSLSSFIKRGQVFDRIIADGGPGLFAVDTFLFGNNDAGQVAGQFSAFSATSFGIHGVIVSPKRGAGGQ